MDPCPHWQIDECSRTVPADRTGTRFGEIIRDSKGALIGAFYSRILVVHDPLDAECIAFREGLLFVKTQGISVDIVESDSLFFIKVISSHYLPLHIDPLITDIRQLLADASDCWSLFTARTADEVAHTLDKFSFTFSNAVCWFLQCPLCIAHAII